MDKKPVRIGTVRVAVAVGLGVIAYTVSPSTGSLATAHAGGECTQANCDTPPPPPPPPPDECDDGFCGTPANPGCGSGCGSGCIVIW